MYLGMNGSLDQIGKEYRGDIDDKVKQMAGTPLRVMAFAFVEMDLQGQRPSWENIAGRDQAHSTANRNLSDYLKRGERPFTFIGCFGLRDPLRPKVLSCVNYARNEGKLMVRLVSGDHLETAKKVAMKAGILREEEKG